MISARNKEEILSAARIEEVIGEFVNLKKRGTNHIGLCPFHTEKTPSFYVSPSKGIFKCFGCGKAGDSITFLMEHEKFSYPESLRYLAEKYHIAIEETGDYVKEQSDRQLQESLYIINQFATEYFQNNLWKHDEGEIIGQAYFKERGITEEMIRKFNLGYSLHNIDAFTKAALKSGYNLELLKKAGLVVQKGNHDTDFFNSRVIFPIHTVTGKVVAFAGRIMKKDEKAPKYINSPETEIYHKSNLVYGIYHARNAIRQHDECFLTEGYTDVIAMHQAGIENVVASSGTSLTPEQIKLIRRFTPNITILYDGDPAGIKAALRGLEMMAAEDVNVRVVLLPDGDDPDSFVHKNGSTALREFIVAQKKHFLQFKVELLMSEAGNDPLKKAEVIKDVVNTLSQIPDVIKRAVLLKECSRMIDVDEQVLMVEVNKIKRRQLKKETGAGDYEADALHRPIEESPDHTSQHKKFSDEPQERDIIRLLLEFGSKKMEENVNVAGYILNEVSETPFSNVTYRLMLHEFEAQVKLGEVPDHTFFIQHEDEELKRVAIEILTSPYSLSENWNKMHDIYVKVPGENFLKDVMNSLDRFKLKKVMAMIRENRQEFKSAEVNEENENQYLFVKRKLDEWKNQLGKKLGTVVVE